jgi:hypothetical protein|tara:strand:+ start:6415 stop:7014 length:600 start_codon:yes stop_codon:yes gene_type:complete
MPLKVPPPTAVVAGGNANCGLAAAAERKKISPRVSKSTEPNQSRRLFETESGVRFPCASAGVTHVTVALVSAPSGSCARDATGPMDPNLHQKGTDPDPPATPLKETLTTLPPDVPIAEFTSLLTNGSVAALDVGTNDGTDAVLADTKLTPAAIRTVTVSAAITIPPTSGTSTIAIADETMRDTAMADDVPDPSAALKTA